MRIADSRLLMKLRPSFGTSHLLSACVSAAYFTFCLSVQVFSGSWSADFLAYPDEPSHFVGAVMVRDWLLSGQWLSPLDFAQKYYAHYPFFAIGYWPPMFSIVTGSWLAVVGVGRVQALMIPAAFAALTGWIIFSLVRDRMGVAAGICAGALYLSLGEVQYWMSAVMVDHMTALFCLATGVFLIRCLRDPVLRNGILCGICCGCAILSKFSAVYLFALPLSAVLLLRRTDLLRKPGLLVQPLIVMLMVVPWALWTKGMAVYGLPPDRDPLTFQRALSFLFATFSVFPPVLTAFTVLGLLALLARPKAWREDVLVLVLLATGHVAFMVLAPIDPDERYLLAPAAALLVTAFAGWSEAIASIPYGKLMVRFTPMTITLLTAAFVLAQFGTFVRMPRDQIREVVAFVRKDTGRTMHRVVVPPTLEGPVIAEFVAQSRHRPEDYLVRPSKTFARSDWYDANYSSVFDTPGKMMEYFRANPVDFLIWTDTPDAKLKPHERLLSQVLRDYPAWWQRATSFEPTSGSGSRWTIYAYSMQAQSSR